MEILVLGPGCPNCKKLFEATERAVARAAVKADLRKVQKLDEIVAHGVLMTPALVINGKVKCSGKVPGEEEIAAFITEEAAGE